MLAVLTLVGCECNRSFGYLINPPCDGKHFHDVAWGEERRAGLAGKKIIKTVEQFTSERRTAD